jgi:hypothetical protein
MWQLFRIKKKQIEQIKPLTMESKSTEPKRKEPKDVKPGEKVRIEWERIKGKIGIVKCLSNDPTTKKMFVQMRWSNFAELPGCDEYEELIIEYDQYYLKNFHLLNSAIDLNKEEKKPQDELGKVLEEIKEEIEEEK